MDGSIGIGMGFAVVAALVFIAAAIAYPQLGWMRDK
jgi:hypothetical protein